MKKNEFYKNEIKDNNYEGINLSTITEIRGKGKFSKKIIFEDIEKLYLKFATQNISDLVNNISFGEEFDANEEQKLFDLKGEDFDTAKIFTFNLVGTIVYNKSTFNINSRFGNEFLQYMIASSNGFLELEKFGGFNKEMSLAEWIYIYYFKIKLKDAFSLGVYKTYTSQSEDLISIRGQIDINHYIKKNFFDGKTRCVYKNHSYSNEINYIISLALNKIFKSKYEPIVKDIHTIKNAFNQVEYKKQNIKFLKSKKVKNPFYSKYNEVFQLALNILDDNFGSTGQDDFSAFLFDISLLFEHHIRSLLKNELTIGIKNKKEFHIPNGINSNDIYPDVIIYNSDGTISIYDVKYKNFRENGKFQGVDRNDRFQLISYVSIYMQKYTIRECGFIYPSNTNQVNKEQTLKVFDKEIPFKILFYTIFESEENKKFIVNQKKCDKDFLNYF